MCAAGVRHDRPAPPYAVSEQTLVNSNGGTHDGSAENEQKTGMLPFCP